MLVGCVGPLQVWERPSRECGIVDVVVDVAVAVVDVDFRTTAHDTPVIVRPISDFDVEWDWDG